ncbi:MAG: TetR/AcrR family transcriptional regulator [Candidatus Omnitrophota bacterium]
MGTVDISELNTRQKIINAALLVAAKEGFIRATTDQIAKRAGVSEGIIYHYFKSKYDLCCNMIKEYAEEFRQKLVDEIEKSRTAKDKLGKLIDFHFEYFTGKDNIFQAIYGKSGDTTVMMGHILKVAIIPYVKIVEDIIRQGVKEGEFKDLNPNLAASSLLGMMQITILRLHFGFGKFSVKDARDEIKRIFLEGIKAKG